jgi:hypothetical protein
MKNFILNSSIEVNFEKEMIKIIHRPIFTLSPYSIYELIYHCGFHKSNSKFKKKQLEDGLENYV